MGMRRKSDLIIKVLSLGVGMAIAVILIAKVCFELSYDNVYKDIDRIYKIRTGSVMQGEDKDFGQVSGAIAPGFKAEVPGVLEATRFTSIFNSENFIIDDDGSKVAAEHLLADSCFFRIFNRQFLAGEPEKALRSWSGDVAISKTFAEKLGGVGAAVGKQIANEDNPNLKLTVCGVYEDYVIGSVSDPDNRPSVRFCWNKDFLTDEEKADFDWSRLMQTLVVKLTDVTPETMRKVEKTIREVAPDSDAEVKSYAETFRSLYDPTRQMKRTYTLGALFALLIAVILSLIHI